MTHSPPGRSPFPWGRVALGWAGVALFFVVYSVGTRLAAGEPLSPLGSVIQGLHWLSWTLATPLLVWASRRLPLVPGRRARRVAAHAALAVAVSAALSGLNVAVAVGLFTLVGPGAPPQGPFLARMVLSSLAIDVFAYTAVVAVTTALEGRRQAARLEGRAALLEAQLARAHLHALRMQLNPHFLFNALQTVSALTSPADHKARRVLRDLGDLLRLSLERTGVQEVPLEEELEFLDRYLAIERVRFQDRLAVEVHVDDGVLGASVPTLLLQPLVENAVKHGVAPHEGAVRIEVRATRQGGRLSVQVSDDGGAPSAEGAAEGAAGGPSTGVGLANVRARLDRLYGPAASLSHGPVQGGGYVVRVDLPYRALEEASQTLTA